jgi:uncharacterized protein YcfJ
MLIAAAALAAMPAAYANHESGWKDDYKGDYDDERFSTSATSSGYADVVSSRPVYRTVEISRPREECWDERVRRKKDTGINETGETLIGAGIGVAIGNQIGNGRGKDAARIGGAILGGLIGGQHAREQERAAREVRYERQCRTVQERHTEQRIDGYDVSYRYGGQTYHTRMPYDPGKRLRVSVSVSPEDDRYYSDRSF